MNDFIKVPDLNTGGDGNSADDKTEINKELAGRIAGHIGTGRNAKDSFIWMTITWSFYIASGLSLLLYIRSFTKVATGENLLDSIVNIWSVFVPIITLALGYAFGKGE